LCHAGDEWERWHDRTIGDRCRSGQSGRLHRAARDEMLLNRVRDVGSATAAWPLAHAA
jgi:hypothetical protein